MRSTLESPDETRESRTDPEVLLFYKAEAPKRWTCAVVKRTGDEAFLVTTYPTDAIKEGLKDELFTKPGDKGIPARITTDADNKKATQILVLKKK